MNTDDSSDVLIDSPHLHIRHGLVQRSVAEQGLSVDLVSRPLNLNLMVTTRDSKLRL